MTSLETLLQMFEDGKTLSTSEHNAIIAKIDHIEQRFGEKIIILEKSSNEWQKWKHYMVAIVLLISFGAPLVVQYFG